ncbi:trehalose-phosphatase [Mycobacterium sp. MYCO198283]|nr:trehalose-phosphatase [Mycobacterium sp. MYCO198283]
MTESLPADLRDALRSLAGVPRLLVASDYDGTLAPIVDRPGDAVPLPEAADALAAVAELPDTTAALISGRALRDLQALSRAPDAVVLVGSHGSEFDTGFVHQVDDAAEALLERIVDSLTRIAEHYPGVTVEQKPVSAALHVRNASAEDGRKALRDAETAAQEWDAQITTGKAVIEFAVIHTDKGQAFDILREQHGACGAVFFGDDVTDEKVFRRLRPPDVGVKVGDGDTAARYRVETPAGVAAALRFLADERRTLRR